MIAITLTEVTVHAVIFFFLKDHRANVNALRNKSAKLKEQNASCILHHHV